MQRPIISAFFLSFSLTSKRLVAETVADMTMMTMTYLTKVINCTHALNAIAIAQCKMCM